MNASPLKQEPVATPVERVIFWSFLAVLGLFGIVLLLPPVCSYPKFLADKGACRANLRVLAAAMHSYHDAYHSFPPAYIVDKNGRPMHSWRVLLLPFLEHGALYRRYHFDEPWNGPRNRMLMSGVPDEFHCPADSGPETNTNYFVVVGPKTVFPGAGSVRIRDITDGTSCTILLVEAADSDVNWLEPRDLTYEEALRGINPKTGWGISSHHRKGEVLVALADGSTPVLPEDFDVEQLRRLLERNDGRSISPPLD